MTEDTQVIRTQELPVLDLGSFLSGDDTNLEDLAGTLCSAAAEFGFFFVKNHGISEELISEVFTETKRFHDQSMDEKLKLTIDDNQRGYIRPKATLIRHSTYNDNTNFDSNETVVFATEYGHDNPYRKEGKRFYGENQWPDKLPGFDTVVQKYMNTMTELGKATLPIWARALGLERNFFASYFENNHTYFRMAHYPPEPNLGENSFGLGPHADTGFMTFLPQAAVDGLEILDLDDQWFRPPRKDDCILVNTGQFLERWTNKKFRASPHRVIPPKDHHRYSIALFVNTSLDSVCECLPTCHDGSNPPQYPTESYWDFYNWYMVNTYPHFDEFKEEQSV